RPVDISGLEWTRAKVLDSSSIKTATRGQSLLQAFSAALSAAQAFEGATAPNPPVACVILSNEGEVLATAAHQKAGQPHAEALAIEACRQNCTLEKIHTLIVTLEPCNHNGRTPPCSEAILTTPAREIWIGAADPNSHVKGGGAAQLKAAGLAVHLWSELSDAAAADLSIRANRLIAPFAKRVTTGLPWITVKQALNSNGTMLPPFGQKTFTSPQSLDLAHALRKRADAILTGSGTVLADLPLLNVRRVSDFPEKRRKLVLMDRRRRIPKSYVIESEARGFDVLMPASLDEAFKTLGQLGVNEVLVEAGPEITNAVLQSGQWDEHVLITQAKSPEMNDEITITLNDNSSNTESANVFRNH
ncbi:MAG: bifunctional diaminohydroxyphosphoribosylaminopyrimidine deaminase/5-amino-6-(5-phosphoribosylamino)uracil reductase RibD, partial [Aestuariivirga sp.]